MVPEAPAQRDPALQLIHEGTSTVGAMSEVDKIDHEELNQVG